MGGVGGVGGVAGVADTNYLYPASWGWINFGANVVRAHARACEGRRSGQ